MQTLNAHQAHVSRPLEVFPPQNYTGSEGSVVDRVQGVCQPVVGWLRMPKNLPHLSLAEKQQM